MKKIIDNDQIQWYHFFPLLSLLTLVALFATYLARWALSASWEWLILGLVLIVQIGLCFLAGMVCKNWSGLADYVSTLVYNCWSKDVALELENLDQDDKTNAKSTKQLQFIDSAFSMLFMVLFLAGVLWLNRFEVLLFGISFLVLVSTYMLAWLPGIQSAKIEDWPLQEHRIKDSKVRLIVDELRMTSQSTKPYNADAIDKKKEELQKDWARTVKLKRVEYDFRVMRFPFRQEGVSRADATVARAEIQLDIREPELQRLKDENRENMGRPNNLDRLVVRGRTEEIFLLCAEMEAIFQANHLSKWDRIQSVLDFCQTPNIEYEQDDSRRSIQELDQGHYSDYWRYPLETLASKIGDCDCHAILAACLFYTLGFECCLIGVETTNGYHMALGVKPPNRDAQIPDASGFTFQGSKYYYCETTGEWYIGELPSSVKLDTLKVLWPEK